MLKIDLSEFIYSLSMALDLVHVGLGVDESSSSHGARVCYITCRIAEQLYLDKETTNNLYYASLLHDVGLVLTKELKNLMCFDADNEYSHCTKGHAMLKNCLITRDFADIILHHHEKLDGAGYPFRVTADAIPLGARILAVSDVFIALAEDRPYRSGYGKNDICLALKKQVADKALDCNLVDIVIKDFDSFYKNRDE